MVLALDDQATLRGLQLVDTMAETLEQMYSAQEGEQQEIDKEIGAISASFWTSVYQVNTASSTPRRPEAASAADTVGETLLLAEMQVLSLLFSEGEQPIRPVAFANIFAHALSGLFERVKSTVHIHDLASETANGPGLQASELSEVIDILASLLQADPLAKALNEAKYVRKSWHDALRAVSSNHRRLLPLFVVDQGAADAAGPVVEPQDATTPRAVLRLASMVRQAQTWRRNREVTGLYTQKGGREIISGFEPARVERWVHEAEARTAHLDADLKVGRDSRQAMLRNYAQGIQENRAVAANAARRRRIDREECETRQKLEQTMAAITEATRHLGFAQKFACMIADTSYDREACVQIGAEITRRISGNDTMPGNYADPLTFATGEGIEVGKGDRLDVRVDGQWIADQALQRMGMGSGALTGPQGYLQSFQHQAGFGNMQSKNQAQAITTGTTGEHYMEGGVTVSAGFEVLGTGVKTHLSTGLRSVDFSTSTSQRAEASQQSSSEERRTAENFIRALRHVSAPFSEQPVGALLLVQEERGLLCAVQALDATNDVLSRVDGKVYFVVNDAVPQPQHAQSVSPHLVVRTRHMRSLEQLEPTVRRAMEEALLQLDADFSAAGGFDLAAVSPPETQAKAAVEMNQRGVNIDRLPEAWRNFFYSQVCLRRANYEREVHARDIRGTLACLSIEKSALEDDNMLVRHAQALTACQSCLLRKSCDREQLQEAAETLVVFLRRTLVPLLKMRGGEGGQERLQSRRMLDCAAKMTALPAVCGPHGEAVDAFDNIEALVVFSRKICESAGEIALFSCISRDLF